jgi:hypothetical protein
MDKLKPTSSAAPPIESPPILAAHLVPVADNCIAHKVLERYFLNAARHHLPHGKRLSAGALPPAGFRPDCSFEVVRLGQCNTIRHWIRQRWQPGPTQLQGVISRQPPIVNNNAIDRRKAVEKSAYATLLSIFGRSQGAKRRLDGVWGPHLPTKPRCYGQAWRHGEGRKLAQPWWEERVPPLSRRELFGHHGRVRGPFSSRASLLSHSPLRGCSVVPPQISAPKISCAGFSTVSWFATMERLCLELALRKSA